MFWRRATTPEEYLLARRILHFGVALLPVAWLLTVAALAGPSWQRLPQPTFTQEQALIIALAQTAMIGLAANDGRILISVSPFLIGKCIGSKMNKSILLHFMPGQLSFCRHR